VKKLVLISALFAFAADATLVRPVAAATTKKKKKKKGAAVTPPPADSSALDMGTPKTTAAPTVAAPPPTAAAKPVTAPAPVLPPPGTAAPAVAGQPPAPAAVVTTSRKRRPRVAKGQTVFDFSDAANVPAEVQIDLKSPEKKRYDKALDYMTDEKWEDATFEWQAILEDQKSAPFHREAEYQLAKATYKLGLFNAALSRFKNIIVQGEQHPRYQKSVEWLFFISRKLVDETPVLEELAQFTNVQWPRKYKNEYRYLLAKYQYLRAYELEVQRLQDEEAKKYKAATASDTGAMDFSSDANLAAPNAMDFSADDAGSRGGANKNIGAMEFSADDIETGAKKTEKLVDVIADVRKLVAQVPPDSKYYPRGKYLEGLANFLEGNDQLAVDAFRNVIQLLNPRKGKLSDTKLREQAFMSLARAHYGYQQFRAAAYYYGKIDKKSDAWLDSLFESSWAYYRLEDYEKALGNLVTLHSPFFVGEYYPEATILEAVVYFENCRYDQVKTMLHAFDRRYRPLMESMKKLSEQNLTSDQYYTKLAELQRAKDLNAQQLVRILNVALSDQEVRRADSSVREVAREIGQVAKLPKVLADSAYAKATTDDLQKVLKSRQARAGDLARAKIDREYLHLRDLVGQAYRIQFETVTVEKTTIESKIAGEATQQSRQYAYSVATDDEKLYWPFDGEYWYDELGTYQYSMSSGCK
jgi:outer membrane protein assembly factor BamD (BamD/ComL family)